MAGLCKNGNQSVQNTVFFPNSLYGLMKILEEVKKEYQKIKNEKPSEENRRKAMPENIGKKLKNTVSN